MTETAIAVQGVSKRYRLGVRDEMPDTFAKAVTSWIASPLSNYRRLRKLSRFDDVAGTEESPDVLYALRDVPDVRRGEVLHIIRPAPEIDAVKILNRHAPSATRRVFSRGASRRSHRVSSS